MYSAAASSWLAASRSLAASNVDGVSAGVRQAETLVRLGARPAEAGSYALPPDKPQRGLSPALARLIGRRDG